MTQRPIKLYAVRHGKTIFNALDRMQGVGNSPLLESGKQEIREIGRHYATRGWQIGQTYHSVAPRTKETLDILQEEMGLNNTPIEAADIEEWNFGSFEGFDGGTWVNTKLIPHTAGKLSLEEMTFAEIADAFHTIDTRGITPNWEGLRDRITRGFEGIAQDLYPRQEDGLVVSHGKTMSTLYYILTGETFLAGIKNGGLLELSWDGQQLRVDSFEPDPLSES